MRLVAKSPDMSARLTCQSRGIIKRVLIVTIVVFALTSLAAYGIRIVNARADARDYSDAQSIYTAELPPADKTRARERGYCGRSVVSKATIQGEGAGNPSLRHSGPPEESGAGAIRMAKVIEAPARSVEILRARSVDWFQRMQEEAIGIRARPEPAGRADR
jgi:hypothetical protein